MEAWLSGFLVVGAVTGALKLAQDRSLTAPDKRRLTIWIAVATIVVTVIGVASAVFN